jgi:hypothetical protein
MLEKLWRHGVPPFPLMEIDMSSQSSEQERTEKQIQPDEAELDEHQPDQGIP